MTPFVANEGVKRNDGAWSVGPGAVLGRSPHGLLADYAQRNPIGVDVEIEAAVFDQLVHDHAGGVRPLFRPTQMIHEAHAQLSEGPARLVVLDLPAERASPQAVGARKRNALYNPTATVANLGLAIETSA